MRDEYRSGLNRTSVGLKRQHHYRYGGKEHGLNRTSVGLKRNSAPDGAWKISCLNRTSVGLKLDRLFEISRTRSMPQSNQRGIETEIFRPLRPFPGAGPQSNQRGIETLVTPCGHTIAGIASIEPAWD